MPSFTSLKFGSYYSADVFNSLLTTPAISFDSKLAGLNPLSVPLLCEEYEEDNSAEIGQQVVIREDGSSSIVTDNYIPKPTIWTISAYISGYTFSSTGVGLITSLINTSLINLQVTYLKMLQQSRLPCNFKTRNGDSKKVFIQQFTTSPTGLEANGLKVKLVLVERNYLNVNKQDSVSGSTLTTSLEQDFNVPTIGTIVGTSVTLLYSICNTAVYENLKDKYLEDSDVNEYQYSVASILKQEQRAVEKQEQAFNSIDLTVNNATDAYKTFLYTEMLNLRYNVFITAMPTLYTVEDNQLVYNERFDLSFGVDIYKLTLYFTLVPDSALCEEIPYDLQLKYGTPSWWSIRAVLTKDTETITQNFRLTWNNPLGFYNTDFVIEFCTNTPLPDLSIPTYLDVPTTLSIEEQKAITALNERNKYKYWIEMCTRKELQLKLLADTQLLVGLSEE